MKFKYVKKAVSLLLAGTMIFSMAGCGKSKEKEKKKELQIYDAVMEAEFDVTIENSIIVDNVLYASYYNWNEEALSGSGVEEQGLIIYDFQTKTQNQLKLDIKDAYINSFYVDKDKNIIIEAFKMVTNIEEGTDIEDVENAEDLTYQYSELELIYNQNLECVSTQEGETQTVDMESDVLADEMVMDIEVDNEGRLFSMCVKFDGETEEYYIKVTDTEGAEIAKISIGEMADSMMKMSDGSIVCNIWGDNGTELYELDIEGNKLGEKIVELTDSFATGMYAGLNNSILINEEGFLKRLDCNSGKTEKILKFMDSGILSDNIAFVLELENGEFYVVLHDYETNKSEIDRLVKQDESTKTVQKEEIHLGTFSMDSSLQEQVIKFNKSSDKYRIIIDDYMSDDEDEYDEAIKKFHAALTSKNCPDIIDLSNISIQEYAQKGVLENLESYLEKDSEINKDLFVQSILDVYKVDDKIYTIPIDFMLTGFSGAKSVIGEGCNWTMQEFVDYAESLPEGVSLMPDMTSDGILWTMLYYSMDEYVDWSSGECNFNSEDFITLLEYCSNFENSDDYYEDYEYDEEIDSEITQIREKKVVLRDFYCDRVFTYLEEKAIFGEDITIKGYPSKEGNGIVVETYSPLLGISSSSKYKDVAWEFLRQFYTAEYQTEYNLYGFSIRQDKLDEAFNEIKKMEPETAKDGTKYIGEYMYGEMEMYIPPMTDEDIKNIQTMINCADTLGDMNGEIFSMIEEETEAFFAGQKSAKEVAEVIQSRVSIYIKENS